MILLMVGASLILIAWFIGILIRAYARDFEIENPSEFV